MAIIRRRGAGNFEGYGVEGQTYINNVITSVNIDLFDLSTVIGRAGRTGSSDYLTDPADVTVTYIKWRYYIRALTTDFPITNTFNSETAKRKYGRFKIQSGNYVVDEQFHSYEYQMSKIYTFVRINVQGNEDEDIPCNEPPETIGGDEIALNGGLIVYPDSGEPRIIGVGVTPNAPIEIGDRFQYYPELGLNSFSLGYTFLYRNISYDFFTWLNFGLPPRLRF